MAQVVDKLGSIPSMARKEKVWILGLGIAEYMPSQLEALGSVPSTHTKKKKKLVILGVLGHRVYLVFPAGMRPGSYPGPTCLASYSCSWILGHVYQKLLLSSPVICHGTLLLLMFSFSLSGSGVTGLDPARCAKMALQIRHTIPPLGTVGSMWFSQKKAQALPGNHCLPNTPLFPEDVGVPVVSRE
jgi:hypothetical protein